jgi:hypothetical protein
MKSTINFAASRIRAAWGVLTSSRCVVITYDPEKPVNTLDHIFLCAPSQEVPDRLANATLIAVEWNNIDDKEKQEDALRQANAILACPSKYCY